VSLSAAQPLPDSLLAQARAGRDDAAVITLGRAVERFPDAPHVYAALGHVWLTEAQRRDDRVALNKAIGALQHAAGRSAAIPRPALPCSVHGSREQVAG
jgi:hypothetical protein